jgi:hypothetical protein
MANKDVLKITFDADTRQFEQNLISSMDNISKEASDKLAEAFTKAGKNPKLKKQLTGIYQGLFDELTEASGDIDKVTNSIDRFAGKIEYINKIASKTKVKGVFDNLSIENVDKIIKDYDEVIEREEKIKDLQSKDFRDNKRFETTVKSLKELENTYGDVEKAKEKYESKLNDYVKNAGVETSAISKQIKEYSSLIALFDEINNKKVDKGTNEAIEKSQSLLFVMQKITDLEKGNALFSNFRNKELQDVRNVTESLAVLSQGVEASISSFVSKLTRNLKSEITLIYEEAAKIALKASDHQAVSAAKTQAKVDNILGKGSGNGSDSGDGKSSSDDYDYDEHNNIFAKYFDTANKSAEELEDTFYNIGDKLELLNKKAQEGDLVGKDLKEYIALYKQLEDLTTKMDGFSVPQKYTEQFDSLLRDDKLSKFSDKLDEIKNKGYITRESSSALSDVDNSKIEELREEIKEVKEDITSLKGRVDTLEDTTAFDNLSSQVTGFDEKLKNVDGSIKNLVSSFKLLSELSLTDLQKVAIPFFNGINETFKENNGNKISGYWDNLKADIEGSNVELRELLKLVGLYDSKSNGLKLISDGMVNSGGLIGDKHVLIARKNKNGRLEEVQSLKKKLDEAYASGINVSRILDVIGTKESNVFLELQETANGNILGNIYGQLDKDFVNTDWLEATDEQIKKLISDMIALQKMGINVESNLTNIMYDKEKGFSFIDMDLDITKFENDAELMQDHMIRIFGDLEDFYLNQNDTTNANMITKARERFEKLSEQVQQSYAEAQNSNSPSKEFEKLENDAVDGIVVGANNNEDKLKNVGKQMAENVKDGFKEGMSEIGATALSEVNQSSVLSGVDNTGLSMDEKIEKTKELIKLGKVLSTQPRVTELQNDPDITDEQEDELQELEQALGEAEYAVEDFRAEFKGLTVELKDGTVITATADSLEKLASIKPSNIKNITMEYTDLQSAIVKVDNALDTFDAGSIASMSGSYAIKGEWAEMLDELSRGTVEEFRTAFNMSEEEATAFFNKVKILNDNLWTDEGMTSDNSIIQVLNEVAEITQNRYKEIATAVTTSFEQAEQVAKDSGKALSDYIDYVDGWKRQANEIIQAPVHLQELNQTEVLSNQTPLSSDSKVDEIAKETAIEVEQANEKIITSNKEVVASEEAKEKALNTDNLTLDTSSIDLEKAKLKELENAVSLVIEEIDRKTQAFHNEKAAVDMIIPSEIAKLEALEGELITIRELLEQISKVPVDISFKTDNLDESTQKVLNGIKESLDGINPSSLGDISSVLEGFKISKANVDNLQKLANAILTLKSNLNNVGSQGQQFLSDIKELIAQADGLKDLATVLNATKKELSEATTNVDKTKSSQNKFEIPKGWIKDVNKAWDEAIKENNQRTGQDVFDNYNNKFKSLNSSDGKIDEYRIQLGELEKILKRMNTLIPIDLSVNPNAKEELKKLSEQADTLVDDLENVKKYDLADQVDIDRLSGRISDTIHKNTAMPDNIKQGLKALRETLKQTNLSKEAVKNLEAQFVSLAAEMKATGKTGVSMGDKIKKKFGDVFAYFATYVSIQDFIQTVRQGYQYVADIDAKMIELEKVSDMSGSRLEQSFDHATEAAKDLGSTISDVVSATADWSRLGYDADAAEELAEVAILYKNVGDGIDIDTANNSLISTLQGFQMEANEAMKIVDSFNEVANRMPIDSAGIGEALQRSAASFNAANTDLNESIALITATNAVVQDPTRVGKNILPTIIVI